LSGKIIKMQNIMLQNYMSNINFLKKYDQDLYTRVVDLSKNLERHTSEKYIIDMESNIFNLIDVENKTKLYKNNPYYDAEYKVSKFYPNIQESISIINMKPIEHIRNPKYEIDSFDYLNEYIKFIDYKKILQNKKFETIGKYIFVGTLLGIHIEKLHEEINSKNYLIYEDSLEIFRLSLFFCEYKKIANSSNIIFAIEVTESALQEKTKSFLKNDSKYNHIIKYQLSSNRYEKSLERISGCVVSENPLLYTFSDYLGAYSRSVGFVKNKYEILDFTKKQNTFDDKPGLYIGPGPSLSKNIKFIKRAEKKFIIVCLSSTLKLLSKYNIIPDIIISIDASTIIKPQFDVEKKYLKNSIILLSSKTDKSLVKSLNKRKVFMVQDSIELFENFGILTGNSSGEMGYSLCCYFNFKSLYLIGMDVALDQKTKNTHDKSYYANKQMEDNEYTFKDYGELDFDKDIIKVKGNFKKNVFTTRRYLQLINNYNQITKHKTTPMKVYNLSHGAYLEGIIPLKVKKINLNEFENIEKKILLKNILKTFRKNSTNTFDKNEKKLIKRDQKIISKLLLVLEEGRKDNFQQEYSKIRLKYPNSFFVQILNLYFELISPYINFLESEKEVVQQKLSMISLKQIKKIMEFYQCKI